LDQQAVRGLFGRSCKQASFVDNAGDSTNDTSPQESPQDRTIIKSLLLLKAIDDSPGNPFSTLIAPRALSFRAAPSNCLFS